MYSYRHFFPMTEFLCPNWNCLQGPSGQRWHGNPFYGTGAMGKYLAWMLIGSVSSLICTQIQNPHKTRNPVLFSPSQRQNQDSGVGIRYCMDRYCWELLANLHHFPLTDVNGNALGQTVGRPFEQRWEGPFKQTVRALIDARGPNIANMIPNTDMSGYSIIVDRIKNICNVWLLHCDKCLNWQDQYALLWWTAGTLGFDAAGNPLYAHQVPMIPNTTSPLNINNMTFL